MELQRSHKNTVEFSGSLAYVFTGDFNFGTLYGIREPMSSISLIEFLVRLSGARSNCGNLSVGGNRDDEQIALLGCL